MAKAGTSKAGAVRTTAEARKILDRCDEFDAAWTAGGGDGMPFIGQWLDDGVAAFAAGAPIPERDDQQSILSEPNVFWVGYMLKYLETRPYQVEILEALRTRRSAGNA